MDIAATGRRLLARTALVGYGSYLVIPWRPGRRGVRALRRAAGRAQGFAGSE